MDEGFIVVMPNCETRYPLTYHSEWVCVNEVVLRREINGCQSRGLITWRYILVSLSPSPRLKWISFLSYPALGVNNATINNNCLEIAYYTEEETSPMFS
ncbi:hypothetical protein J6590_093603 [Homalodisca vitripennis]|nr:hypothetical protein J6590_093603 [Homalodisca vitripennis]